MVNAAGSSIRVGFVVVGSLIGKGCYPLGAALYLKADEARRLRGQPVRPRAVMAETAQLRQS